MQGNYNTMSIIVGIVLIFVSTGFGIYAIGNENTSMGVIATLLLGGGGLSITIGIMCSRK